MKKKVISILLSTTILLSVGFPISIFAESKNTYKNELLSEINVDEKIKTFMILPQDSLPEGLSVVETKVISENHVIQYFEDSKLNRNDSTEIKLENGEITLDFYSGKGIKSSKIDTIIMPVHQSDNINTLADDGDFSWHLIATDYSDADLSNRSFSNIKSIMIGIFTKGMPVLASSAVSTEAGRVANQAYGSSKVTVRTQRKRYWRNCRPSEPRNYLHSWEYETKMWKNFDPVKVVSKFTEQFYHDYK